MTTYLLNDPLSIDRGYGTGSVTGYISTDGTLGHLDASHITDWSITMQFGIQSYTFIPIETGILMNPTGLTATTTELLFSYTSSNSFGFKTFNAGITGGPIIDWASGCNSGECGMLIGVISAHDNVIVSSYSAGYIDTTQTIATAIATVPTIATVPGPIVGTGLPGLLALIILLMACDRSRRHIEGRHKHGGKVYAVSGYLVGGSHSVMGYTRPLDYKGLSSLS